MEIGLDAKQMSRSVTIEGKQVNPTCSFRDFDQFKEIKASSKSLRRTLGSIELSMFLYSKQRAFGGHR
jgi:hypothetical protein